MMARVLHIREGYKIFITVKEYEVTLVEYVIDGFLYSNVYFRDDVSPNIKCMDSYANYCYGMSYCAGFNEKNGSTIERLRFKGDYPIEFERLIFRSY